MSCKECKQLQRQLDAAQAAFTSYAQPFYRDYAKLSFTQVQQFEQLRAPYASDVRKAKSALTRHEGKCAS